MMSMLQDAMLLQQGEAPDNGYGCRYQTEEDAACQRALERENENAEEYGERTGARQKNAPWHSL